MWLKWEVIYKNPTNVSQDIDFVPIFFIFGFQNAQILESASLNIVIILHTCPIFSNKCKESMFEWQVNLTFEGIENY